MKHRNLAICLYSAIVGSLTIGCTFFLSFLVGVLSDTIGNTNAVIHPVKGTMSSDKYCSEGLLIKEVLSVLALIIFK
jgi:hypothetical protein